MSVCRSNATTQIHAIERLQASPALLATNRAEALNVEQFKPIEPMKLFKQLTVWLFVSLSVLGAAPTSAMEMTVSGSQLILSGFINELDYDKFLSHLTPAVRTVVFTNSPGGLHLIGLALAHEIRRRGLSTVASGYCNSACANAFLGGTERRLANSRSYVAFHGNYSIRSGRPLAGRELSAFYSEMTNGRLNDQMIQLFLSKGPRGLVSFYKRVTRNCDGTETKRPSGCPTLPITPLELGILTALDDVAISEQ